MLADMRHTGAVRRRRPEGDGKDLIVVVIFNIKQTGTGLVVMQFISLAVEFRNVLRTLNSKAVNLLFFL